jgi:hypothetical protein
MSWPKGKPRKAALSPSISTENDMPEAAADTTELDALRAELAAAKAKLELRAEIRTELSDALRLQQEEQKRIAFGKPTLPVHVMPPKPDEKLVEMKLERNYAPRGYYEIVGYHKDAIFKKFPDGTTREVEPASFISGEKKPAAFAGVNHANKLWAGQVAAFPEREAKQIRRDKIGNVELAD